MVAKANVHDGRPVTIPDEVLSNLGVEPWASLTFRQTGPYTAEITVWPRPLTLAEMLERDGTDEPYDAKIREEWQAEAAKDAIRHVGKPTPFMLEEVLTRFRVDGPVDEGALREAWQDDAAKEVFGR